MGQWPREPRGERKAWREGIRQVNGRCMRGEQNGGKDARDGGGEEARGREEGQDGAQDRGREKGKEGSEP